jgi:WD40 repeat protein
MGDQRPGAVARKGHVLAPGTRAQCLLEQSTQSAPRTHTSGTQIGKQEGNKVFSSGADNAARMLDLQGNPNQPQQVAQHDGPIKAVRWIESPQGPILITGSWDKTVKVRSSLQVT